MLERIRGLEAEKLEYIADGLAIPSRITYGLMGAKVELEEARLYGHREHVREIEEARKEAEARDIGERVGAELERVRNAPKLEPEDLRAARAELGVTQAQLAAAAGIDSKTISAIENGKGEPRPGTMYYISRGLEFIREHRGPMSTETRLG